MVVSSCFLLNIKQVLKSDWNDNEKFIFIVWYENRTVRNTKTIHYDRFCFIKNVFKINTQKTLEKVTFFLYSCTNILKLLCLRLNIHTKINKKSLK